MKAHLLLIDFFLNRTSSGRGNWMSHLLVPPPPPIQSDTATSHLYNTTTGYHTAIPIASNADIIGKVDFLTPNKRQPFNDVSNQQQSSKAIPVRALATGAKRFMPKSHQSTGFVVMNDIPDHLLSPPVAPQIQQVVGCLPSSSLKNQSHHQPKAEKNRFMKPTEAFK
jgi:hypothetical protein